MAKNILIIDDDKLIAVTLKRLLTKEGYSVTTALGGAKALTYIENNDFDLILSDIKMPEMDGVEVIRKIREYLALNNRGPIPEIFITAYAKEEIYNKALELSACGYLEKPFDVPSLLKAINSAIEK